MLSTLNNLFRPGKTVRPASRLVSLSDIGGPLGDHFKRREKVQFNADFGNDGVFISSFLDRVQRNRQKKKQTPDFSDVIQGRVRKKFDLTVETIEVLGDAHLSLCYCCPYIEGALRELEKIHSVIESLDEEKRKLVCSAGLLHNTLTWERLRGKKLSEPVGNGFQHCVTRMRAIAQLWPQYLTDDAVEAAIAFLIQLTVSLPQDKHPRLQEGLRDEKVWNEVWELAWMAARTLAKKCRRGKKKGFSKQELSRSLFSIDEKRAKSCRAKGTPNASLYSPKA